MTRRYGRAKCGHRLVAAVPHGHWKTTTFVGALRCNGLTAPLVIDGAINGELFLAYVEQVLVPTLKPDDVVIGYVSRIAPEKNVEYLAESLAIVAAERPAVRALLVGDGPSRSSLEAKLTGFARFVGYQNGEALADHYSACDIFAFSSLTETFGNVVLEAMSSGLPVVALRSGGVAEIVLDGRTGILIEPDQTPRVFADALIRLVDRERERHEMSRSARDYALSQSWDSIMGHLRNRYLAAIEGERLVHRGMDREPASAFD